MQKILIILGISLRVREYLGNRSLKLEEASLALNIINKSFVELIKPLDLAQYAPIGFLWLEKLSLLLFGNNEYSLRLFPLLASLLAIPLFYKVSKYFLPKKAVLLSLFIFSILDILIYYSSELKQYSFDVLATLFIYYSIIKFSPILLALGALIIWFSHASIFILAVVGITMFKKIRIYGLLWIISFTLFYWINLRHTAGDKSIEEFWQWAFAKNPIADPGWYYSTFLTISKDTLNLSSPILAVFILIGCVFFFRWSKQHFFLLVSPLIFATIASMMHFYPLLDRFILFFIPNLIILFTYGVEKIFSKSLILKLVVIILAFYPSIVLDLFHLQTPRIKEDTRSVIEFYSKMRESGDIIYVYYASESPFRYYSPNTKFILGKASRENPVGYRAQIDELRGKKRVWFLFSHVVNTKLGIVNEEEFFLSYLDNIGKRFNQFQSSGASIYLYDLDY